MRCCYLRRCLHLKKVALEAFGSFWRPCFFVTAFDCTTRDFTLYYFEIISFCASSGEALQNGDPKLVGEDGSSFLFEGEPSFVSLRARGEQELLQCLTVGTPCTERFSTTAFPIGCRCVKNPERRPVLPYG